MTIPPKSDLLKIIAPKHCGMCGDTHAGDCHPDSFAYFQCSTCLRSQMLPRDALFALSMGGMYCGCGDDAGEAWKAITHEKYKELETLQ